MKLKSAFTAIAVATAITGGILGSEAGYASPCMFGAKGGASDSAPSGISNIDPTTIQAKLGDFNRFGIAGAGIAVLGGFIAGGVLLKRHLDRKAALLALEEAQTESAFAESNFAIEVPQEALRSVQAEDESELTSIR